MKILKYLLYTIIGLIALFVLIGLMKSSVSYGHEIMVDKPLNEAWAVTQDPTKYSQWLEGFQSMELIEGEKLKAGSKYRVIVNPGDGQEDFEMIETVLSIKEFEEVEMTFDSDMMVFDQTIYFKEKDGMTSVRSESKVKGKGLMMRSMFAIMEMLGGTFTAQEAKNFEALKTLIESNTTDYYPVEKAIDEMPIVEEVN